MAKRYDEDESILQILKDGERMHFSMMTMDSEVLPARDVTDATAPLRVVDALGHGGLALHKPGPRYLTAGAGTVDHAKQVMADHMRREARDQYIAELCDSWKSTSDEVAHMHNGGDARTDAYLDQKYDLENSWHRGTGKR
jgi:hypothetical protein